MPWESCILDWRAKRAKCSKWHNHLRLQHMINKRGGPDTWANKSKEKATTQSLLGLLLRNSILGCVFIIKVLWVFLQGLLFPTRGRDLLLLGESFLSQLCRTNITGGRNVRRSCFPCHTSQIFTSSVSESLLLIFLSATSPQNWVIFYYLELSSLGKKWSIPRSSGGGNILQIVIFSWARARCSDCASWDPDPRQVQAYPLHPVQIQH